MPSIADIRPAQPHVVIDVGRPPRATGGLDANDVRQHEAASGAPPVSSPTLSAFKMPGKQAASSPVTSERSAPSATQISAPEPALTVDPVRLSALLTCPISKEHFIDPVLLPNGYTYERNAVADLLKIDRDDPRLISNVAVKKLAQGLRDALALHPDVSTLDTSTLLAEEDLQCAIATVMPDDPVTLSDGHTYSFEKVAELARFHWRSPMSRESLSQVVWANHVFAQLCNLLGHAAASPATMELAEVKVPQRPQVDFDGERERLTNTINILRTDPGKIIEPKMVRVQAQNMATLKVGWTTSASVVVGAASALAAGGAVSYLVARALLDNDPTATAFAAVVGVSVGILAGGLVGLNAAASLQVVGKAFYVHSGAATRAIVEHNVASSEQSLSRLDELETQQQQDRSAEGASAAVRLTELDALPIMESFV